MKTATADVAKRRRVNKTVFELPMRDWYVQSMIRRDQPFAQGLHGGADNGGALMLPVVSWVCVDVFASKPTSREPMAQTSLLRVQPLPRIAGAVAASRRREIMRGLPRSAVGPTSLQFRAVAGLR